MFIVDNLRVPTILAAVASIMQEGLADTVFGRIGTTATVSKALGTALPTSRSICSNMLVCLSNRQSELPLLCRAP